MQLIDISFILLIISTLLILALIRYVLKSKPINQIQQYFALMLISVMIICVGLIIQQLCVIAFNAEAIYFEGFIYIGTCYFPVLFFLVTLCFVNTKIKLNKKHLLLFVIPTINILSIFTNDFHHLFYKKYSSMLNEMVLRTSTEICI